MGILKPAQPASATHSQEQYSEKSKNLSMERRPQRRNGIGSSKMVDESQFAAGEMLVCQGTDLAWTSLFLAAAGLITEAGGLMTHGSVVASKSGIAAVAGVTEVTIRLETGQRIRVDGSAGTVQIMDGNDAAS